MFLDIFYIDLLEYNYKKSEINKRMTWKGKIQVLFGKIASGVCIYKMFLVFYIKFP